MEIPNKELRKKMIQLAYANNLSHNSSALSCVDAISYLYNEVLTEKDLFILSKGHGSLALYTVLNSKNKSPKYEMHPKLDEKNGIYATTGSLGHGLPIGLGRAYAKKIKKDLGRTYILTGDGEMEEGSVWESLILANKLDVNLNLLVDWNKYQVSGSVQDIAKTDGKNLEKKLRAFGCKEVLIIDGHENNELSKIKDLGEGLNAIVLNTIKGKGIPYLEKSHAHGFNWKKNPEKYQEALKLLS